MRTFQLSLRAMCGILAALAVHAAEPVFLEASIPAGTNYSVAQFRFWHPTEVNTLAGVLVLVPGSNADGRGMAGDPYWQTFATRHNVALVGCHFKDHPHADMNIEEYARAGDGSGTALLEALRRFARESSHPEAASAKLLLWGHSAGGEFNFEFACWKPDRVSAFVVNKGGYYFTHLAPAAARKVPGIFFVGGKDEEFRIQSIRGIFAINERAGAIWKLTILPEEGHEEGTTRNLTVEFFESVLRQSSTP